MELEAALRAEAKIEVEIAEALLGRASPEDKDAVRELLDVAIRNLASSRASSRPGMEHCFLRRTLPFALPSDRPLSILVPLPFAPPSLALPLIHIQPLVLRS
eukprot:3941412-Rhodomonas_salina.1